jgi:hypothetical protein
MAIGGICLVVAVDEASQVELQRADFEVSPASIPM